MHRLNTAYLLVALLAACGPRPVTQAPSDGGQHFCCAEIDVSTFSGTGCEPLMSEDVTTCDEVLFCAGTWKRFDAASAEGQTHGMYPVKDGTVSCESTT
jgi:hypothetical protein